MPPHAQRIRRGLYLAAISAEGFGTQKTGLDGLHISCNQFLRKTSVPVWDLSLTFDASISRPTATEVKRPLARQDTGILGPFVGVFVLS